MTGGTLGVPRTLETIAAHPVTCYLFGGGKGDQRVHFNKSTNVGHAKVNVSGGIIYHQRWCQDWYLGYVVRRW